MSPDLFTANNLEINAKTNRKITILPFQMISGYITIHGERLDFLDNFFSDFKYCKFVFITNQRFRLFVGPTVVVGVYAILDPKKQNYQCVPTPKT